MNLEAAESISVQAPLLPSAASTAAVNEWLRPRRFALLLLVLVLAAFPEVILYAKTFHFRDYALFGYPLAHYHREAFWRGEIPLWNPLNASGIPYVAQWNTMVFYPLSLIYLLLPLPWSLGWFCLFHLFLAGLGMYYLASRWTNDRLAASVAGIVFAFNGLTLAFLIWPNNIAALGWLPWVWLCVEQGWKRGGVDLLKAAAVAAVQMLSGAPEVILFTWLLLGGAWLWQFSRSSATRWILVQRFTLIGVLVVGLSAIQLLPFLDLLGHSHRSGQTGNAAWSMPAWGLANFFVPLFRGQESSLGVFLQPKQGWTSSYYLGIATLLFAATGVWKVRHPAVRCLGIAVVLSLILALGEGTYVYPWLLKWFPFLGIMRYPIKFVVITGCAVPLLAAFAIAHWKRTEPQLRDSSRTILGRGAVACLIIVAAIVCISFVWPGEEENPQATLLNGISRAALLILTVAAWFALRKWPPTSSRWAWLLEPAFLLIIWFDLISHAPAQNPTVDARAYTMDVPAFARMQPCPKAGESRALLSWGTMDKFHSSGVSDCMEAVLGFRMGLYCNCNLLQNIPKVDGFYSLYLPEERELRFRLFPTTNNVRPGLADFLGVSQIGSDRSFLDWEARPSWMPMITSGQSPKFASPPETFDALLAQDFDPRKTVFLPREAEYRIAATNGAAATILSQSFSPHRISIEATADKPSIVVVAQSFYHWWNATVDGQPVPLWRANHAFQAVEVPSGKHQISFVYQDRSFQAGTLISGASIAVWAGLFLHFKRRRSARLS